MTRKMLSQIGLIRLIQSELSLAKAKKLMYLVDNYNFKFDDFLYYFSTAM